MKILIADDHVVRAGIRQIVLERKDWEICGEATTGRQAVGLALKAKPNVVIMGPSISNSETFETNWLNPS
jgi:DNA-binding NarL/FixJ family response regulator